MAGNSARGTGRGGAPITHLSRSEPPNGALITEHACHFPQRLKSVPDGDVAALPSGIPGLFHSQDVLRNPLARCGLAMAITVAPLITLAAVIITGPSIGAR